MGIFVISIFCAVVVYYIIKAVGNLFLSDKSDSYNFGNKYINKHELRLAQEKEYQDYIEYCKRTNQPFVFKKDEYFDNIEIRKDINPNIFKNK